MIHQEVGNLGIQNRRDLALVSFNVIEDCSDNSEGLEILCAVMNIAKAIHMAATQ